MTIGLGITQPKDDLWKKRISDSLKGKKKRPAWKKKISESQMGNKNALGKKRTREQKIAASSDPLAWLRIYL